MDRRDFVKALLAGPLAAVQALYAQRTKGLPPLTIQSVKVFALSPGGRGRWVLIKIQTSEPGLYGIGSGSNFFQPLTVATAIEKHFSPWWVGKSADRIEDQWQSTHVRSYWRNSTILNNALSALDVALWDIKGKRAGMPVYELLGGKARDAVALYAHADGRSFDEVAENVKKFTDEGYRHVRAQMGGYGGGGMIPSGQGRRVEGGYQGPAFDEERYVETIPKLFEHLRVKLGHEVKLLHDVHEHLSPAMAVELAKRLEPYRLFFLEDVLPPEQIAWFHHIKQVTTTPQAMGELFTHPHEWTPLIAERLIDFIRCRLSQVGGITMGKKIAALCEMFGVRTAWQEGGDNDPVNRLASYHVDMAISSFGVQEENHFPDLVHELLPGTAQLKGGYLYGSDKPGLGIDLREDLAAKHPFVESRPGPGMGDRAIDGSLVKP